MIRVIQHNCARSYKWIIAGHRTGVESGAYLVFLQEPPRETRGIGICHFAYEMRETQRTSMPIQRVSGVGVGQRTDSI